MNLFSKHFLHFGAFLPSKWEHSLPRCRSLWHSPFGWQLYLLRLSAMSRSLILRRTPKMCTICNTCPIKQDMVRLIWLFIWSSSSWWIILTAVWKRKLPILYACGKKVPSWCSVVIRKGNYKENYTNTDPFLSFWCNHRKTYFLMPNTIGSKIFYLCTFEYCLMHQGFTLKALSEVS